MTVETAEGVQLSLCVSDLVDERVSESESVCSYITFIHSLELLKLTYVSLLDRVVLSSILTYYAKILHIKWAFS